MRNKELWIQVRLLSNTLRENSSITNGESNCQLTSRSMHEWCPLLIVIDPGGVVCVSIPWQINNLQLKKHVYRQLNLEHVLDEEKVVFKLRNFSGALVPLSNQLESNAKDWYLIKPLIGWCLIDFEYIDSSPFVLEVVDIHQHGKGSELSQIEITRLDY